MSKQDEKTASVPLLFPEPPREVEIPDKLYFKIGEVCRITGVAAHVLRFWESQFPQLRPGRTDAGHRLYTRSDVGQVLAIKHLLYNQKLTMKGAKKFLRSKTTSTKVSQFLAEIADELSSIRDILS
ncbi:MAG: MerR family transcriptional regulator [Deltaproteobacteria bacterium]|nr:MAG: MerR family transcriptional regulator [Deltaproteobacteria bacterium]